MKTFKKISQRILIVLIILVLGYTGLALWQNRDNLPFISTKEEDIVSVTWVEDSINSISEYSSLLYHYTNVSEFEDKKDFNGWELPLTTKRFLIQYDGEMKLGIDTKDAEIDIKDKIITIHFSAPKILSHTILEETIEVFDQSYNIFNQIEINDYKTFALEEKKVMEEKAYALDIFNEAGIEAKKQISGFLNQLPEIKDQYEINIIIDEYELEEEIEETKKPSLDENNKKEMEKENSTNKE